MTVVVCPRPRTAHRHNMATRNAKRRIIVTSGEYLSACLRRSQAPIRDSDCGRGAQKCKPPPDRHLWSFREFLEEATQHRGQVGRRKMILVDLSQQALFLAKCGRIPMLRVVLKSK